MRPCMTGRKLSSMCARSMCVVCTYKYDGGAAKGRETQRDQVRMCSTYISHIAYQRDFALHIATYNNNNNNNNNNNSI
jgi:hypothetical protein